MRIAVAGLLLFAVLPGLLKAQAPVINANGSVTISKTDAEFLLQPYPGNILKVIVTPKNYSTNELVSDAVTARQERLKPTIENAAGGYNIAWNNLKIAVKGDSIFFGDKKEAVLCGLINTGSYRGFRFLLAPGEKIFGSGERALPLNRRGYKINLYNQPAYGYGIGAENLNYSVPFISSSGHYSIFFDNASKGYLDIGKNESNILEYGAFSGELNFYLIPGNSYQEILASFHVLTGKQPLPPRWALGNFLSRFGYMSEAEVKSITQKMQRASIPYDAVILDLFWFGDSVKGTMGNLDWVNKKAWPHPRQMISDLKKQGTKMILITEPYVVTNASNYETSKKYHAVDSNGKPFIISNFYFGPAGLIDIFRKDSRDWFWKKYKMQMNKGVEGWWGDLGEPETHPANIYHNLKDLGFKRLFKADEVHNIYGHYWTKMLYEQYAKEYPGKRLFSLNRSGFAGTQRYGIFPWTGDVSRSWSGLQAQLPVLLGMSMSGIPYVHSDAGGFAGSGKDAELYVRWLQFAQFTPVFKPHGTELGLIDSSAGNFPSEPALFEEPYLSIAKKAVEERYALLPYNYTLAYEQATKGNPLISPLYYYFSSDTNTYKIEDELMWGGAMLVAPVLQKGAASRPVYLPAGNWYGYKDFKFYEGRRWITDTVDLHSVPVYIKAGSFIPGLNSKISNTSFYSSSKLTVTYFPSAQASEYILFDDDGHSDKSLEKKQFELITFKTSGWNNGASFNIKSDHGQFKGKPAKRIISIVIPRIEQIPGTITLNGKSFKRSVTGNDNYFSWNGLSKILTITVTFTGEPIQISISE